MWVEKVEDVRERRLKEEMRQLRSALDRQARVQTASGVEQRLRRGKSAALRCGRWHLG
jgi:hypothetical protein